MSGRRLLVAFVILSMASSACGRKAEASDNVRLYTTVTQETVDAVVQGFQAANPGVSVEVFRAPTGELAARIAAERREGTFDADVLWLTDPLSIEGYARDGILRSWTPADIETVPASYRTDTFFGTRLLNLVIVSRRGGAGPADWADLVTTKGVVALPDPAFAGSAFAALGFFGLDPDYGLDFYRNLARNGAVQVNAPGDVITGVAEGQFQAGITLDQPARSAVEAGSPIELVWPESGAIAVFSPIAVVGASTSPAAEPFVDYVLGVPAQTAIAQTGWQPIRPDVEWPVSGPARTLDWERAFDLQDQLLSEYQAIFGS